MSPSPSCLPRPHQARLKAVEDSFPKGTDPKIIRAAKDKSTAERRRKSLSEEQLRQKLDHDNDYNRQSVHTRDSLC